MVIGLQLLSYYIYILYMWHQRGTEVQLFSLLKLKHRDGYKVQ